MPMPMPMPLPCTVTPIWPATLQLGEGALWHAASSRFFFVDIRGQAVHSWSPDTDVRQSLTDLSVENIGSTPEQFAATIRTDIDKWMKLAKNMPKK